MRRRREMMSNILLNLLLLILLCNLIDAGGHNEHKHIIIHVPYKIKTIHHTHTITKHIHHGGGDKYEVLGYTVGHPNDLGGHSGDFGNDFGGGAGGHDFGGGSGGHDFSGGSNSHIELSGGGHGRSSFGGGGGFGDGFNDGFGGDGGGHED